MTRPLFFLFIGSLCFSACSNDDESLPLDRASNFTQVVELPDVLTESSGMMYLGALHFWSHNDSGDDPLLYQASLSTSLLTRTVQIDQANHVDWEAMTTDDDFVYIGDFGNNQGDRTDLTIYKFSENDLTQSDQVPAAAIFFNYEDQVDFIPSDLHNFDCEAMISLDDQLWLFTKNRSDFQTNIYTLPKTAGTHEAQFHSTLDVFGLITDAAINEPADVVCLLGYNANGASLQPFVWLFYDFQNGDFLSGKKKRIDMDFFGQTEAVCFKNATTLYFTTEEEDDSESFVYSFDVAAWLE